MAGLAKPLYNGQEEATRLATTRLSCRQYLPYHTHRESLAPLYYILTSKCHWYNIPLYGSRLSEAQGVEASEDGSREL